MENASQALIIAAGVLIGIVIISMGVYLFTQAAAIPKNYSEKLENDKLAAFNEKFEIYSRIDATAQDIVTVINLAIENNRQYDETDKDYYITIEVDGAVANDFSEQDKIDMLEGIEIVADAEGNEVLESPYECTAIEYSSVTGRVIKMKFKKE